MSLENKVVVLTTKDVRQKAKEAILAERTGRQLGLRTRYSQLNVALGKYFRFGTVTSINGLSGHGKSYLLNLLTQDFTNTELNGNCYYDYIIAAHSFEMLPEDELLRSVSSGLEKSYMYLLSSEFDVEKKKYNTISEQELQQIDAILDSYEDKPIYYFDNPTTLGGIAKNVKAAIEKYQDDKKITTIPKVIITIDHTLLIKQAKGENQILDTMRALAGLVVGLKKKGYMVIMLGQLNNNIEKIERIRNPEGHYPIKSDIYAQGEIFNACDNVITIHQPEMLGLLQYGKNKWNTEGLVHLQLLKQRFGKIGSIWLQNNLSKGTLIQCKPVSNMTNIRNEQ
jgi:replicative DNA helicase